MVSIEYIPESEAPRPTRPASKGAEQSLEILKGIKAGTVAKILPDESKSVRGIKASLTRVAKSAGIKIQVYQVDDDPAIYVRKLK